MEHNRFFNYIAEPTDIFGLKYRPKIVNSVPDANDSDWVIGYNGPFPSRHFSEVEENEFAASFLTIRDNCNSILEIGVDAFLPSQGMGKTSTRILLDNKKATTKFVGIDLNDKSYLASEYPNVYTIQNTSVDVSSNLNKIETEFGISTFDYIFIDGFHSINVLFEDWKYVSRLTIGGIVAFHDCNFHPGPVALYDAIDEEKFAKSKIETSDLIWGIAFAERLR